MTGSGQKQAAVSAELDAATSGLDGPLAALHLPSLRANHDDLLRRAAGTPLRIATKSVRCRDVLRRLALPDAGRADGVVGLMAYSVAEAHWLAGAGHRDVLVGYPSVDRSALTALAADGPGRDAVTLMVDDAGQLRLAADHGAAGMRVCLDVDASLRLGPVHVGVRRSPLRSPGQVVELARVAGGLGFRVDGLMFYEAQVAGVSDDVPGIRAVKWATLRGLPARRAAVLDALRDRLGLRPRIVNSGGSGSVAESAADPRVTEVAAGSGFYGPASFDHYRSFRPLPALMFALPAVRRPAPGITTLASGGFVASGKPGRDRLPTPVWPAGMRLLGAEGAGEVQTPVRSGPPIGGRAWFRHAKAGELLERLDRVHLVDRTDDGPATVAVVPTYRGEGRCFG